jgi:hypothetical protein
MQCQTWNKAKKIIYKTKLLTILQWSWSYELGLEETLHLLHIFVCHIIMELNLLIGWIAIQKYYKKENRSMFSNIVDRIMLPLEDFE